jgi:hypothetical protein
MLTQVAFYQTELRKLLLAEIERRKENIVTSHKASDFDFSTFKHHVGIIEGLRMALELSEEAESMLNQR